MKKEIIVWEYITKKIIPNNENCTKILIESYNLTQKIIIFLYDDCAKICKIIQRNDGLFVKEYFTIDYEKSCVWSAMDSFNFEDFIKKYPMDSVNSKLYEKLYTWEELGYNEN